MNKKYELVNQREDGLYQIKALRDFGNVKNGELGGWVQGEQNLSHKNLCWVYGEAMVFGNARVGWNAKVSGNAWVYGGAMVHGDAKVYGHAEVYDGAEVAGNAKVFGNAKIYGNASVVWNAKVYGRAEVSGDAWVSGKAEVYGDAIAYGKAEVSGDAICTKFVLTFVLPKHNITVTDNLVAIGCEQHTLEHWLANYKKIGLEHNYSKNEIKAYGKALKAIKYLRSDDTGYYTVDGNKLCPYPGMTDEDLEDYQDFESSL